MSDKDPERYEGWWIKICTKKTKARKIVFSFAEQDIAEDLQRHVWHSGENSEIPLPSINKYDEVYLHARGEPHADIYFGLCHGVQVCCKHYDFDETESHTVKKGDSDEWDCT